MIRLTARAARELRQLLVDAHAPATYALRLAPDTTGRIARTIAAPQPGDLAFNDAHGPVLLIAGHLATQLGDLVFDWQIAVEEGRQRGQLGFRRLTPEERGGQP